MNPLFHTEFSISDSLKNVRKSVLIYETIIGVRICHAHIKFHLPSKPVLSLEGFLFEIDEE